MLLADWKQDLPSAPYIPSVFIKIKCNVIIFNVRLDNINIFSESLLAINPGDRRESSPRLELLGGQAFLRVAGDMRNTSLYAYPGRMPYVASS
jgi:hypothetical protein